MRDEVYTWDGVYRHMSYSQVEQIHKRCYDRMLHEWDYEAWNDGLLIARDDYDPFWARNLLEVRLTKQHTCFSFVPSCVWYVG